MLLTESEARTKWCPYSIASHWNHPNGGNRLMRNDPPRNVSPIAVVCRCIASECMAWQFVDMEHDRPTDLWSKSKNKKVNSAYGDDAEWRPVHGSKDDEPPLAVGYCGLASNGGGHG